MPVTTTSQQWIDCEGRCCCRCDYCKGIGYWSQYDINFGLWTHHIQCDPNCFEAVAPPPDTYVPPVGFGDYAELTSFTLYQANQYPPAMEPSFGSQGGVGHCNWGRNDDDVPVYGPGIADFRFNIFLNRFQPGPGWPTQLGVILLGWDISSGFTSQAGEQWNVILSGDCRTGFVVDGKPIDYDTWIGLPNSFGYKKHGPHKFDTITITPSAGAVWRQCGLNSDGTNFNSDFDNDFDMDFS